MGPVPGHRAARAGHLVIDQVLSDAEREAYMTLLPENWTLAVEYETVFDQPGEPTVPQTLVLHLSTPWDSQRQERYTVTQRLSRTILRPGLVTEVLTTLIHEVWAVQQARQDHWRA